MARRLVTGSILVFTIALVGVGCSSSDDVDPAASQESASNSTSTDGSTESTTAEETAGGSDFCTLLATQVSQGVVRIHAAEAGGVQVAEGIAEDLAAKAPVTQSELQAVAPPEPLSYLRALEDADAKGAAGDFSAMDSTFQNLTLLNDWAIANCDAEYTPIFVEYKDYIG